MAKNKPKLQPLRPVHSQAHNTTNAFIDACNDISYWGGTNYIHNKVILIDPVTETPTVISGSANFSDNSILRNDENTLVIKGNTKVANFYFTEFARVFNHYSKRSGIKKLSAANLKKKHNPNQLWKDSKEWVPSFCSETGFGPTDIFISRPLCMIQEKGTPGTSMMT